MHDEYRLTAERLRVQEERKQFDWSLRRGVQLTPLTIADSRLSDCFESIKTWADHIAAEHGVSIEKIEAIIGHWQLDNNFNTVWLRWTSSQGIFMREFGVTMEARVTRMLTSENPYAGMSTRPC